MKKFLSMMLVGLISSAFLLTAYASPEIKSGENLLVTAPITEDAYFAGGNAKIDSEVKGDLYIAGGQVVINGNVGGDLVVVGGKVTVMGNVAGDFRVLGGDVSLYGNVTEDLIALGGNVIVGNKSMIGGSIEAAIGNFVFDGQVKGEFKGTVGVLTFGGQVGGDMELTVQDKIMFTEKAKITGSLKYSSLLESTIPQGVVGGQVEYKKFDTSNVKFDKFSKENLLRELTYSYILYKVASYLSVLLVLLLLVLMCPNSLMKFGEQMKGNGVKAFGVGLLTILLIVIASILLMATIVGIPLALIMLVTMFIGFYVAKIFVSLWIAGYIFTFNKKKKNVKMKLFFATALVLLLYYLIGLIPIVGWLIVFVLFLIGLGQIVLFKRSYYEFLKGKGMV